MSHNLLAINFLAFSGEKLARGEFGFVVQCACSGNSEEAIMANGILLVAGNAAQRHNACKRLEALCRAGKQDESSKAEAFMITSLEYLPAKEFVKQACYRAFAYRAAKSHFVPARVNAMRVLRRLGKIGYHRAVRLLRDAVKDTNLHVRNGAKAALRLIGESGMDVK